MSAPAVQSPAVQSPETTSRNRERKALIGAGVIGSAALVLAMSGTLSDITASITNSTNTAGVGSLAMTETGPDGTGATVSCSTTATATSTTCGTINKYGGSTTMTTSGASSTSSTAISIQNTGTMAATTFTLTPGTCTLTNPDGASGDLCSKALVTVVQDGKTIVSGVTPAAMAANGAYTLTPVAAGATSSITVTFSTAGLDNTVQGESLSQPLTWTFNA